jgi:hypothetical protein
MFVTIPGKMDKSDADSLASVNMKEPIPELATITRSYSVTSEPLPVSTRAHR